jgi:hypothetical protein
MKAEVQRENYQRKTRTTIAAAAAATTTTTTIVIELASRYLFVYSRGLN